MARVLSATSGCLASVGIALLALAALSLPTQAASTSTQSASTASICDAFCEADLEEDVCTCVTESCSATHCFKSLSAGCNGWCTFGRTCYTVYVSDTCSYCKCKIFS